ncbi:MAG: isoprenylcysteine carboxylmethyltransferase family protein [Terracidiphilus sp.]
MRATKLEFRLRMAINTAIIILGFWAPWIEAWGPRAQFAHRIPLLEWLPLELSRARVLSFTLGSPIVIVAAAIIAGVGAILRVWGSSYLGPATVHNLKMKAGAVMADGPYRYVRNPLYLGLWCMVAAVAFLMPPTGALCTMTVLTFFLMRLILGEEAFLSAQLGEPYHAYTRAVPRLIPRLHSTLPRTGAAPQWLPGVLTEITPIGVFVALAFLSWSYDNRLMVKAIIVSLGLSLVARALTPGVLPGANPAD